MIENKIGLDNTEIVNIEILDLDIEKLFSDFYKGIKNKVKDVGRYEYIIESGKKIPSIKIIDGLFFKEMLIKVKCIPDKKGECGYKKIYTCMSVGAGNILPDNRNNITIDKYRTYVTKVLPWYLQERYGIITDFSNVKIQSVEINANIALVGMFKEYNRVLNLLINNVQLRGNIHDEKRSNELPRTYWKRNNVEEIIMYDKKQSIEARYNTPRRLAEAKRKWQIKQQILEKCPNKSDFYKGNIEATCSECLRIELRLYNKGKNKKRSTSSQKIEKIFSIPDTLLDNLNDELIETKFREYLTKIILHRFCRWYILNKKMIRKLIIEYKQNYGQSWQQYFYPLLYKIEVRTGVLCIIDFIHLRDCINFDSKKDGIKLKHNASAILDRFRKKEAQNREWDALEKQDSLKIIEIFSALGFDYENEFVKNDINILPRQVRKQI